MQATSSYVFLLLSILTSGLTQPCFSEPWVDPGNERTRHHLQNLVDSGASQNLVTSWPLMWSNINNELKKIDPTELSNSSLWSYKYLRHEFKQINKKNRIEQNAFIGNSTPLLRDFSSDSRNEQEGSFAFNHTGTNSAFRIKASYIKDANGDQKVQLDGSHLSFLYKNWVLGIGTIDRWWGPGWESSLILSNNARPTPSLFLQRNLATSFQSPWISWIGPWQLTTFMSQLESDRGTPDARLWGMRVNFRPLQNLEVGLSRTAMWGGEGRPNGLETFIDLLIGLDNYEEPEKKQSKEPGNQLAGVDLRWSIGLGAVNAAIYGQLIGEDEAGGMPSRHIGLSGIEINSLIYNTQARFNLEGKNTTVYFYETSKKSSDVAYEHFSLYPSGYRYKGMPIGASTDNDSESITLRSQLFFQNGHALNLSISKNRINMDGDDPKQEHGGNIHGRFQTNTTHSQISYSAPLSKHLMLKAGAFNLSEPIIVHQQSIENGIFIQLNTRW